MIRSYQVILLCYVLFFVFLLLNFGDTKEAKHSRPKRYLTFGNNSHFFLRLNVKVNMVPWNQIFAQSLGFRLFWDEPPDSFHPYHHLQRRTVYSNLEILLDRNGLNGFHCIRRAICEMKTIDRPREIYHRILKMVFSQRTSATDKWHDVTNEECQKSSNLCPFSVLDVSLYTDI